MATPAETRSTSTTRAPAARPPILRLAAPRPDRVTLLADVLAESARRWPDLNILERRSPSEARPCTFAELDAQVDALAAGLLAAGLNPGDRVALFADNCREWLEADQALARAGLVSVPRGTDTAPAELQLIVEHSGARAIIAQTADVVMSLPEPVRQGRQAWLLHHERGSVLQSLGGLADDGRKVLAKDGREILDNARAQTTGESPCTIVYTSGTTGRPKGVVLTHGNVLSNLDGVNAVLDFFPGGRLLSILPSWHMFERILEYVALSNGCALIYTDRRQLKRDMEQESPHAVAFVPRIWEMLASGLQAKLDKVPSWKKRLLETFQELGLGIAETGGSTVTRWMHQRLSRILLKPLWKALGGELRLGVSGGGALPESVDRFLLSLGIPLLNGYGLTETSPVLNVRTVRGNRMRAVGPPLPDTEIRIVKDGADVEVGEAGEVVARGPQVMQGYYRDEEQTKNVLDDDGWFRTGDLGSLDGDGWLYITGRLKDTIVLSGGENVEPEPIECHLRSSPLMAQVMLVGQDERVIGALVVPDHAKVTELHGEIDGTALAALLRREIDSMLGSDSAFRPVDRVGPFAIVDEEFTTENGCMTATLKLRRHVIMEKYGELIAGLYDRG